MSKLTHLTLVRHGTTEWMEAGLTHGRLDSPLSIQGVSQVQNAAAALKGRKFDAFYSSPTGRAWQTAGIISSVVGLTPKPLDLLMEKDFGQLEGTQLRHLSAGWLNLRLILGWLIPLDKGGETYREVYHRAGKALELMITLNPGGSILVVSHHGLINMLLKRITGQKIGYYLLTPASITEIEVEENGKGKIITDLKLTFAPKTG